MNFIDIHSHILPCFDDGPENVAQCIEAGRRYMTIGVESVVATPHWIRATKWSPSPQQIADAAKKTEQALNDAGVALTILPGMEITVPEKLNENFISSSMQALGSSNCYLIEFPFTSTTAQPLQHLSEELIEEKNLKIIIAHPERCALFQDNDTNLRRALDVGMLVQMNIDSILGGFGLKVRKTALHYLRLGLVHFLATDSHAGSRRLPPDIHQWQKLENLLGQDILQMACADNPRRMLAGRAVRPISLADEKITQFSMKHFPQKTSNIVSSADKTGWLKKFINILRTNKES